MNDRVPQVVVEVQQVQQPQQQRLQQQHPILRILVAAMIVQMIHRAIRKVVKPRAVNKAT